MKLLQIFTIRSATALLALFFWFFGSCQPNDSSRVFSSFFVAETNASWYGQAFQGRKTASGEKFDQNAYTAAHRYLNFGTIVRVTNLENQKTVEVRINDRGPFVKNRGIDLSKKAAEKIGIIEQGVGKVRLEIIDYQVCGFKKLTEHQKNCMKIIQFQQK